MSFGVSVGLCSALCCCVLFSVVSLCFVQCRFSRFCLALCHWDQFSVVLCVVFCRTVLWFGFYVGLFLTWCRYVLFSIVSVGFVYRCVNGISLVLCYIVLCFVMDVVFCVVCCCVFFKMVLSAANLVSICLASCFGLV